MPFSVWVHNWVQRFQCGSTNWTHSCSCTNSKHLYSQEIPKSDVALYRVNAKNLDLQLTDRSSLDFFAANFLTKVNFATCHLSESSWKVRYRTYTYDHYDRKPATAGETLASDQIRKVRGQSFGSRLSRLLNRGRESST